MKKKNKKMKKRKKKEKRRRTNESEQNYFTLTFIVNSIIDPNVHFSTVRPFYS